MQFVYPAFLYALSAVSIPILIHLFHFRRYKKIVFSDLRFLKHIEEETRSRRRLKELLVLLCRILAIVFLVLCFAQPFIPAKTSVTAAKGQKAVSVFIDNSFSMNAGGSEGTLLEEAKNKGRAIISSYGTDDLFQVLSNDFEGVQQRLLSRNDALSAIDGLKTSSASRRVPELISRQRQALEKAAGIPHISYLISDFQAEMLPPASAVAGDSTMPVHLLPVQAGSQHNLYIDTAWLLSPAVRVHEPAKLMVRVKNSGQEDAADIPVTLKVNGTQKALQNVACKAGASVDLAMSFTPSDTSWQQCELSLIDHPITFDDRLFFVIRAEGSSRVLCINGAAPSRYIAAVFDRDPSFHLSEESIDRIDYSSFGGQQCIILNEPGIISGGLAAELVTYVNDGGLLFIIPPPAISATSGLNALLSGLSMPTLGNMIPQPLKVSSVNLKDEMLRDVFVHIPSNMDLPTVSRFYKLLKTSATAGTELMKLNNGSGFLHEAPAGKGRVLMLACPLDPAWSNFAQHALFVPLMLKAAFGTKKDYHLYYETGNEKWIQRGQDSRGGEKILRIRGAGVDVLADAQRHNGKAAIYVADQLKQAGIYTISEKESGTLVSCFAENYNRRESETRTLSPAELEARFGNAPMTINVQNTLQLRNAIRQELNGREQWRICLALSLVFLLIEILLLKLLK